jgi:hypothetical protein
MAILPITKATLQYLSFGYDHFFPEGQPPINLPFSVGDFDWKDRAAFIKDVSDTAVITISPEDPKIVEKVREALKTIAEKPTEEAETANAKAPTKAERERFEAQRQATETAHKKAAEEAAVRSAETKRQQEIYSREIQKLKEAEAAVKNKKIYYRVQKPEVKEAPQVKKLEEEATASPKKFVEDSATLLEKEPVVQNLNQGQKKTFAGQAAINTYDVVTGNSPAVQAAVISGIVSNSEILNKFTVDPGVKSTLTNAANVLIEQKKAQFDLTNLFVDLQKIDGIKGMDSININYSFIPQPGFADFDFGQQVIEPRIESLIQQGLLVGNTPGLTLNEIGSEVTARSNAFFNYRFSNLPAANPSLNYSPEMVRAGLSVLRVTTVPLEAAEGSLIGKLGMGLGLGPVLNLFQEKTGIDFGIKKVTEAVVGKAVGAAGLTATLTPLFAWAGPAAPFLAAVASFIAKSKIGKFVSDTFSKISIFLKKNNLTEFAAALLVATPFGAFFGFPGFFITGGLTFAGLKAANASPSTLANFGSGMSSFFGGVFGGTLETAGMVALVSLLSFPVIVVLILFIINSGAYITPPTLQTFGVQIHCTDSKDPVSFPNTTSNKIAFRAWQITADLYEGFWCYWNRPPSNNPSPNGPARSDFPNDVTLYPPGYPNYFSYEKFKEDPNGNEKDYQDCGSNPCMFWCTSLIQQAYRENGDSALLDTLSAPNMDTDFRNRTGKFIPRASTTYLNVVPGSVIFFGEIGSIYHVGLVYSVDKGGVHFVQANAPTKDDFLPFGDGGIGLESFTGLDIDGIGLP